MNEIYVHVTGVVATEVSARTVDDVVVASFRMVSTTRRYDREQRSWVDGDKTWLTVTCWRGLGENVRKSILKGERVVVTGKLRVSQWRDDDDRPRSRTEIVADAVGHDLTFGTTVLTRAPRVRQLEPVAREVVASSLADQHERETDGLDVDELLQQLSGGQDARGPLGARVPDGDNGGELGGALGRDPEDPEEPVGDYDLDDLGLAPMAGEFPGGPVETVTEVPPLEAPGLEVVPPEPVAAGGRRRR